jgi:predicted transcriptional regulator
MHHIKTGILAREVMNKNFPIIDSSQPLINCVKKMNKKHEACLVIKDGKFSGVLGHDDLLRGFMYSKDKNAKIDKIKIKKNFEIVRPESDVYNTLLLMRENDVDFVIVKNKDNFVGLITKKEIADIEPILFEDFQRMQEE